MSKIDKHIARPEGAKFDTRSQVTVEALNLMQLIRGELMKSKSYQEISRGVFSCQ